MLLNANALPSHVPGELLDRAGTRAARRMSGNCSGADVYHLAPEDAPASFLKVLLTPANRPAETLAEERACVAWLADRLRREPAGATTLRSPGVLDYRERDGGTAGTWCYLLTAAVPGQPLHRTMAETPIRVGRLMGRALRRLHELDPSGCPRACPPDALLDAAEANVKAGRIMSTELRAKGPAAAGKLLDRLRRRVPDQFDPVVCHGDYCLPNVLATLDDACGLVDLGGLCVADRHLDAACAVRSLRFNGGLEDVVRVFTNWYGPDRLDESRLRWYGDLAELV